MASYYYDSAAAPGGDGSIGAPFNTLASRPTGAHSHYLKRGSVFYETFTVASSGCKILAYGSGPLPIIDCGGVRDSGINMNSGTGVEVAYLRVIGQNAAAPNAAIRVTGSGHHVHHCEVAGNRFGIHLNASANNRIEHNLIDIGNEAIPGTGYGVRLNGSGCTGNRISQNRFVATGAWRYQAPPPTVFGVAIELSGAVSNRVEYNVISAPICDHIIMRATATTNRIFGNLCFGTGMLDGIDVLNSDGNIVENNTIIHPGDVAGHAGPCMAIGDDYGVGVAATNTTVRNNLLWATNRLCMSLRPNDATNVYAGNRYFAVRGDSAIINYKAAAIDPFTPLSYSEWMALGFDTGSTAGDPMVDEFGRPLPGSPLLTGGNNLGPRRDLRGVMGRGYVGAYAPVVNRVWR